jgi:hypothetical protein
MPRLLGCRRLKVYVRQVVCETVALVSLPFYRRLGLDRPFESFDVEQDGMGGISLRDAL